METELRKIYQYVEGNQDSYLIEYATKYGLYDPSLNRESLVKLIGNAIYQNGYKVVNGILVKNNAASLLSSRPQLIQGSTNRNNLLLTTAKSGYHCPLKDTIRKKATNSGSPRYNKTMYRTSTSGAGKRYNFDYAQKSYDALHEYAVNMNLIDEDDYPDHLELIDIIEENKY